jgi:hypothetical protein
MPDRQDGTAAAGTIKNEHGNKRGSIFVATATTDAESESKATNPLSGTSGPSAKEPSPKKRRKVNHGQNANL